MTEREINGLPDQNTQYGLDKKNRKNTSHKTPEIRKNRSRREALLQETRNRSLRSVLDLMRRPSQTQRGTRAIHIEAAASGRQPGQTMGSRPLDGKGSGEEPGDERDNSSEQDEIPS